MIELIRIQSNRPRSCTYKSTCSTLAKYRTGSINVRIGETHTIAFCPDCAEKYKLKQAKATAEEDKK